MSARYAVELVAVTKRYGATVAVDNVSLRIPEGNYCCLLGPSGCGKTSMLRMIAGHELISDGDILISGQNVGSLPPVSRGTAMMFQSYALFPHLSSLDNVAFSLKMRGVAKAERRAKAREFLALIHMSDYADRLPAQLSGGQQQRVALARALVFEPDALLLDEPLGALDRKLRETLQTEIKEIQRRVGISILYVTHDQDEAMTMSDRIAVMDHGKLMQVAPPGEIYEQPNSKYVADFIGNINILEGKVASRSGNTIWVASAGTNRTYTVESAEPLSAGQSVFLAIRPEKMRISLDPPSSNINVLTGEVFDIGYLGDWTNYIVDIDGAGQRIRASAANMSRFVERPISWEDKVHISFAPDAGVLLTK
jgi:putrescine transport system ATP-binding protein